MNEKLVNMLTFMLKHHIIGAKHFPESILFRKSIKNVNKEIQKEFYSDYEHLLKQNYFIRLKKRTGKGSEYHISINPEMIEDIIRLLEE